MPTLAVFARLSAFAVLLSVGGGASAQTLLSAPDASTELQADAAPAETVPATETPAAGTVPSLDPMDPRLATGGYGIYVGDEKEAYGTSARVGIVDGVLYLLAARIDGHIHEPLVPEQAIAVPVSQLLGVGLKKYGLSRQVHIDFGDRRAIVSLGGTFVDRKGTTALYDALVSAGVPVFEPARYVGHRRREQRTIHIYY